MGKTADIVAIFPTMGTKALMRPVPRLCENQRCYKDVSFWHTYYVTRTFFVSDACALPHTGPEAWDFASDRQDAACNTFIL